MPKVLNKIKTSLIVLFLILGTTALTFAQAPADVNVTASLNRDTIGLDEQAVLTVEVSGTEQNLPNPQMPTLSMFEVYSQGRTSSVSIVNGQVSSTVTYRYLMLPTKSGTFPVDNIAVVHKNRRYKADRLEITVLDKGVAAPQELEQSATDDQGQTKNYFLEAVVDKKNPYVNEQVTLTLKLYLGVKYYGSPELTEPTTTGFWTEILGNKTPYYQKLNNRTYKVVERKYALFPTQTGELTIGRAAVRLTVATQSRSRMRRSLFDDFFGQGEEVTIRSQSININVKPLPEQGLPGTRPGQCRKQGPASFCPLLVACLTHVVLPYPILCPRLDLSHTPARFPCISNQVHSLRLGRRETDRVGAGTFNGTHRANHIRLHHALAYNGPPK